MSSNTEWRFSRRREAAHEVWGKWVAAQPTRAFGVDVETAFHAGVHMGIAAAQREADTDEQ